MNPFPEFYKDLCSDVQWYENAIMSNRGKNFKGAAEFVYAQLLADPDLQRRPMVENRKHVYNRLCKMDYDRVFPSLQQEVKEEKVEEFKPASDEHVKKCVAEFDEMWKNSSMINAMPRVGYKQSVEEGQWIPKKGPAYPVTSPMEAYKKERRVAYISHAFEARTGDPIRGALSEVDFNLLYDNDNYESFFKKLEPKDEAI